MRKDGANPFVVVRSIQRVASDQDDVGLFSLEQAKQLLLAPSEAGSMQVGNVRDLERRSEGSLRRSVSHFDAIGLDKERISNYQECDAGERDQEKLPHDLWARAPCCLRCNR